MPAFFSYFQWNRHNSAIPNEIEILNEDSGNHLVVVLNGNNQVTKIDINTGEKIWVANVGIAPFGIVRANKKLFVTNWGGGIPDHSDPDVAGVPWGNKNISPQPGQHVKVRSVFLTRRVEKYCRKLLWACIRTTLLRALMSNLFMLPMPTVTISR